MSRDEAPTFGIGAPLPPMNLDAEMGLLGGLLARNDELHRIGSALDAEAFYDPANGKLFTLIAEEIRAGRRCDAVTLKVRLQNSGMLDEVGGTAYLSKLLASMVAPGLMPDYANAVRDAWLRRRLAEAATDLHHLAHGDDSAQDGEAVLSNLAGTSGSALHGVMSIGDAARRAIEGYEAVHRGDLSVVSQFENPKNGTRAEVLLLCMVFLGGFAATNSIASPATKMNHETRPILPMWGQLLRHPGAHSDRPSPTTPISTKTTPAMSAVSHQADQDAMAAISAVMRRRAAIDGWLTWGMALAGVAAVATRIGVIVRDWRG